MKNADKAMYAVKKRGKNEYQFFTAELDQKFLEKIELEGDLSIGAWVLREACRQMRTWHDKGGPLIPISVNLSSQQFHQLG